MNEFAIQVALGILGASVLGLAIVLTRVRQERDRMRAYLRHSMRQRVRRLGSPTCGWCGHRAEEHVEGLFECAVEVEELLHSEIAETTLTKCPYTKFVRQP